MYHEFRNTHRDSWKFAYQASELASAAAACRDRFTQEEMESRNALADLLRDPNVSHEDKRIVDLKRKVEHAGEERERCLVYAYEFLRRPEREFLLSLGDVVYFGLAEPNAG